METYKLTPEFIKKTVQEIETEDNLIRKRVAWNSDLIKDGGLKPFVKKRIEQMYPKTHEMYSVSDYSILKRIVDKKSKAYKESPLRRVARDEAASEIYNSIVKNYNLNGAMKCMDEYYNQHKYSMIAVFMDREPGPVSKPNIFFKFYALAPYEFDVVKDSDGKVQVVILSYPSNEVSNATRKDGYNSLIAESGNNDETDRPRTYAFWTKDEHLIVTAKGKTKGDKLTIEYSPAKGGNGLNPYGVLPFVYIPMDFNKNYPTQSPLPAQTVELNALMSVYLTSANMQIGILKITRPESQKLNISSQSLYTAIEAPQSSRPEDKPTDVEFISPSPNMSGHKEAITTYLTTILDEQGINGNQVIGANQEFNSGFDRLLAQADVQSIIEENQEMYSKVEQSIYSIVSKQLSTVGQNTLPSEGFQIIFKKPRVMITDKEKLENIKLMKDLGLWEDAELIQQYDPNLTIDEAKAKLLNIQNAKAEFANMFTDPSKVFNGAQVQSIVEIASKVGLGELTYDAGVSILIASFGVTEEQAKDMLPKPGSLEKEDNSMDDSEDENALNS